MVRSYCRTYASACFALGVSTLVPQTAYSQTEPAPVEEAPAQEEVHEADVPADPETDAGSPQEPADETFEDDFVYATPRPK